MRIHRTRDGQTCAHSVSAVTSSQTKWFMTCCLISWSGEAAACGPWDLTL